MAYNSADVSIKVSDIGWRQAVGRIARALIAGDGGGGASAKEYASFYRVAQGFSGVSTTATTFIIDTERVNSDGTIFSLANNELTINKTGDFRITFNSYINQTSTSRSEYGLWIERDSGGGYSEETATRSAVYERGYDSGMSGIIDCILSVTSGDKFRFRIQRTDGGGNCYQDANGTRLIVEEK